MHFTATGLEPTDIDHVAPVQVGPGCRRRDLPSRDGVRIWVVDMDPGAVWPHVDQHGAEGEDVFVVAGEMIEGETRYGPGTYLKFGPHSAHRPWTEIGVRLFGFNLLAGNGGKAEGSAGDQLVPLADIASVTGAANR